jgi:hypothetical protein
MTILISFLVIAILLGIAGSIILMLGLTNKKTGSIILGSIMLFFTVLFCSGSVALSVMHHHRRCRPNYDMRMPMNSHHMHDDWGKKEQMNEPCCKQDLDSTKTDVKKLCHKK